MTRQRNRANLEKIMFCTCTMYRRCEGQLVNSLPGNIEVALSTEEPHVHLHLRVQVAHADLGLLLLLRGVLLHLPDGVKEEENQYRH